MFSPSYLFEHWHAGRLEGICEFVRLWGKPLSCGKLLLFAILLSYGKPLFLLVWSGVTTVGVSATTLLGSWWGGDAVKAPMVGGFGPVVR